MIVAPYVYADVAVSYRMAAEIECLLDQRSRQASVCLASIPGQIPVEAFGRGVGVWTEVARSLPVDWEANARIERLIASQPKTETRKPLRRK